MINSLRIGQGYDCHALVQNHKLIIGGIIIDYPAGLLGHSDADVLLHAVIDALLGAAGLGDIGCNFPDTKVQFKNISSRKLLRKTSTRINTAGYKINNIDTTIIAHAPKLNTYIPKIILNMATDLNISAQKINIKTKTNNKLGYIGREEGIAAMAITLLEKKNLYL